MPARKAVGAAKAGLHDVGLAWAGLREQRGRGRAPWVTFAAEGDSNVEYPRPGIE